MMMSGSKAICAVILAIAIVISFNCQAQAGDTDPSGARLRSFVEGYLNNPPANDGLARKVNDAGGPYASDISEILCHLEITCTLSVGYDIWESRMHEDKYFIEHFPQSAFIPANITKYCIEYSNVCNHWKWDPYCLAIKLGSR